MGTPMAQPSYDEVISALADTSKALTQALRRHPDKATDEYRCLHTTLQFARRTQVLALASLLEQVAATRNLNLLRDVDFTAAAELLVS